MPIASPVYRQQPIPRVLQPKAAAPQAKKATAAPPVYRPQPVLKCLQPKAATPRQSVPVQAKAGPPSERRPPSAPPASQARAASRQPAPAPSPVIQRRTNTAARPAGLVSRYVIQRKVLDEDKFYKLHNKKKCSHWAYAINHYAGYNVGADKIEWLEIARALNCELPADIGHGSGNTGEFDSHVNDYLDSYIAYKVKPHTNGKKRKTLYNELVRIN